MTELLGFTLGTMAGVALAVALWKLLMGKSGASDNTLLQQQIDGLRQQVGSSLSETQRTVREELHLLRSQVDNKMSDSHHLLGDRLGTANQIMFDVQKSLAKLSTSTEQVVEMTKDISDLQNLLRPPKLRGSLGELLLAELLGQVLARGQYSLQYAFRTGEIVDAVIHLNAGLVPIDSKFPLDNFQRILACATEEERSTFHRKFAADVRKHVDAISQKYIRPNEGTFDFALMYIPAENVYYETILKDDSFGMEKGVYSYALKKKVIPVSPNSFYAYLQAIALGLKGLCIEASAMDLVRQIRGMSTDMMTVRAEFDTLGLHLSNASKKYGDLERRLSRFEDKILALGKDPTLVLAEREEPLRPPLEVGGPGCKDATRASP